MSYNSKYKSSKIEEILDSVGGKQDAIADLDAIRSGAEKGATALQSIPSEYVTETELTSKGYATTSALNDKVDKVSGKGLSTEDFTSALKAKLEGLSNYDDTTLSNAISGLETRLNTLVSGDASTAIESFNEIMAFLDGIKDTQDLASIIASIEQQIAAKQDKITDLDTIRSGAAKGATALQSYTEKYTGTITGITMNGASNGTSGVVDLGNVVTSVKINGSTKTPANGVVDLGTISGGGGSSSGGNGAYSEVNHGTSDTTFTLTPNTFHIWEEVSALTLTLGSETAGVANEFLFQFTSGATATSLTLPDDIKWANDAAPVIAENMIYQVSILKGLASVLEFAN
jgi:hypothetical protein